MTHLAAFDSSESTLVAVDADGRVKAGPFPGEATISARFEEQFANCDVTIPLPGEVPAGLYDVAPAIQLHRRPRLGQAQEARPHALGARRRRDVPPPGAISTSSAACRRPDEARAFLADPSPDKRARLVDRLLDRPEYADHWANKWVDLLRPNPYRVGIKAVLNLDAWIRDAFRRNMPYDQFVREIVTARGSTFEQGPATIFRDRREPDEIAPMVSQLFLGIRLECAKCHHHPFESWGQDQFYEFAAYFARVGRKGTGLSPPISGGEEIVFTAKSGAVKHPLTGKVLPPKPLFGSAPATTTPTPTRARRWPSWMTAPENPVLRPGDRQPRLGRPDGPRDRRAGGRPPRDQPAQQRPAARRPGRRLPPTTATTSST